MILQTVEQVRRIFRIVAGFTLLGAGVVMLAEFVWARQLMDRIKREGNRIKDTVLGRPDEPPPRPPAEGPAPGERMPS